jgi:predicted transcriptional regulator
MNRGYVKVWRKVQDSGLMQIPNTFTLFMHILFSATHKDIKVGTPNGVILLKRGQYISGRIELASALKQSEQQIRTSLKRLQELEMLTSTSTNRFSVYTIVNYSKYQDHDEPINQQENQQTTSSQPAGNQQTTTKQEHKHINTKEEYITQLAMLENIGIEKSLADAWLKIRKKKKMPLTEFSLKATIREAEKANMTLDAVLTKCCEKGWAGFEATYLQGQRQDATQPKSKMDISGIDYSVGVTADGRF